MRPLLALLALLAAPTAVAQTAWTQCAAEGGTCTLTGPKLMRYGQPWTNRWTAVRTLGPGSIPCTNAYWGDPSPGTGKRCQIMDAPAPQAPAAAAWSGEITFEWDAVTTNTDGSPVCGPVQSRVTLNGQPQPPTPATTYTASALPAGTYCGTVAAIGSCGTSGESGQACKTLAAPAPAPTCTSPKPADEAQTVQCAAPTVGSWTQARTYAAAPYPTCWIAGAWTPAAAPDGACVTPPPAPRVVSVVSGLSHAPLFGISASGARQGAVLGFAPVGAVCTGPVVYTYRGRGYRRLADPAQIIWWESKARSTVAAPCN